MLRAHDLTIRLGRAEILRALSMSAMPREVTAIIGPNGSGKTTLLRALTGELRPATGTVRLDGADIAALPPGDLAARRAVLPQQAAMSFPFTASEIVRIGLTTHPGPEPLRDALIRDALAAVGLPGHAGRLYQRMSGGEQQRVQLARALAQVWQPVVAGSPRWLFLDEPVSSLDIAHQLAVMRLAADYAARGGGVVAVMHDLNLTAMFAHRVILMRDGRILGEGAPAGVMTDALLSRAYGCQLAVSRTPRSGIWFLPQLAGP